jgi:unsaturated rhamnogalacturonyl hydrolase
MHLSSTTVLIALAMSASLRAVAETPAAPAPEVAGPCFARFVPERMDDFAWENDRIAFRMYGPALGKAEPDHSGSGIDVWVKSVRKPILNSWYATGRYHRDHGEGLDYYKVGLSRGCGGLGIWNGTSLDVSGCYAEHRVVRGEGDEVEFELSYAPWTSGKATVSEVKNIRLAKESNFFEARSTFKLSGAEEVTVGIGLALRVKEGVLEGELRHGKNWIAYAEPADKRHGQTYTAVILPAEAEFKKTDDHALLLLTVRDGAAIVYRAGAAWEKGLDFNTPEAWFAHVAATAEAAAAPRE